MNHPKRPRSTRYRYETVLEEVRRVVLAMPRGTMKALAKACNTDSAGFSKRMASESARFTIEHLGAIADALQAPPGWPFVPMGRASLDALSNGVAKPPVRRLAAGQHLRRLATSLAALASELGD